MSIRKEASEILEEIEVVLDDTRPTVAMYAIGMLIASRVSDQKFDVVIEALLKIVRDELKVVPVR